VCSSDLRFFFLKADSYVGFFYLAEYFLV